MADKLVKEEVSDMDFKILIADDEKDIVEMLSAFFTGKGYAVLTAYDGEETLKKIESRPDIILLDVNMPGMDGFEVCRQVREHVSHDVDNRVGATLTLFPVLDSHAIVYHILDIATVFGQSQSFSFCIIFHSLHFVYAQR